MSNDVFLYNVQFTNRLHRYGEIFMYIIKTPLFIENGLSAWGGVSSHALAVAESVKFFQRQVIIAGGW